jgi:hypothetical protein
MFTKLLVINFLIKLLAQKHLFTYITEKYGQNATKLSRQIEKTRTKLGKIKSDIQFLMTCKRNKLTPVFAKPKISIKMKATVRWKITETIINTEMQNQRRKQSRLKEKLRRSTEELRSTLGFITFHAFNFVTNKEIKRKKKTWRKTHDQKLKNLFNKKQDNDAKGKRKPPRNIVHNFSTYTLTPEEEHILTFGLDHHIESKLDDNSIKTEFEAMYYHLDKHFKDLPTNEKDMLKSKIRRTCENYINLPAKSTYDETIKKLSMNKNIVIIRQDKGKGVVIMDRSKYIEKCLAQLETSNFKKLDADPTQKFEKNVQTALKNIKTAIGEEEYKKIYPSGSNPGKFYGTAKVHKLSDEDAKNLSNVAKLPLRPIVSNIGTATYKLSKYLAQLLTPLGKSRYTVTSTEDFINRIKLMKPRSNQKMISFDVVSLFTNVPLEKTIDIILRKVYRDKLIQTKIKREDLKNLLYLCTKEGHFTFNGETYIQTDGVMMGSPLGSLIANIFMCELENDLIPTMNNEIEEWTRFVDDTFALIDPDATQNVLQRLNSYDPKIQFTYEEEKNETIPFLDVLIKKTGENQLVTTVYRKKTNNNVYMNWNSYSPRTWKIGTLKNLIRRAAIICSNTEDLEKEFNHLETVFCDINEYPVKVVKKVVEEEKRRLQEQTEEPTTGSTTDDNTNEEESTIYINLPFAGPNGETLMKKLKQQIEGKSNKVKIRATYTPQKLGSKFVVKDKTKDENLHNVTYHVSCGNKKCKSCYVGQTKCRIIKRTLQHNSKDNASHVLIHSKKTKHRRVSMKNVKILGRRYKTDFKRKISESLFIKQLKPDLNKQKDAFKLKLYN